MLQGPAAQYQRLTSKSDPIQIMLNANSPNLRRQGYQRQALD